MLEAVITSSILIFVVLILRGLFGRRMKPTFRYVLWLIVVLRLALPFSLIKSSVSVMNLISRERPESSVYSETPIEQPLKGDVMANKVVPDDISSGENQYFQHENALPQPNMGNNNFQTNNIGVIPNEPHGDKQSNSVNPAAVPSSKLNMNLLKTVWLSVMAIMLGWFVFINISFYHKLRNSRQRIDYDCPLRVYSVKGINSPCIFGLLRPSVYVTDKALENPEVLKFAVAHEYSHYRHGDMLWSAVRFLLLSVYWFNPLVWAAAILSKEDCEYACDEAAIKRLGEESRLVYGRALVSMIPTKTTDIRLLGIASTSMTGGKRAVKERVALIAGKPKNKVIAIVIVLAVVIVSAGLTFTSAKDKPADKVPNAPKQSDAADDTNTPTDYNSNGEIPDIPQQLVIENTSSIPNGTPELICGDRTYTLEETYLPENHVWDFATAEEIISYSENVEAWLIENMGQEEYSDSQAFTYVDRLKKLPQMAQMRFNAGETVLSIKKRDSDYAKAEDYRIDLVMTEKGSLMEYSENLIAGKFELRVYDDNGQYAEKGSLSGSCPLFTGLEREDGTSVIDISENGIFSKDKYSDGTLTVSCLGTASDGKPHYYTTFYQMTFKGDIIRYEKIQGDISNNISIGNGVILSDNIMKDVVMHFDGKTDPDDTYFTSDYSDHSMLELTLDEKNYTCIFQEYDDSGVLYFKSMIESQPNEAAIAAAERAMMVCYKLLTFNDVPLESKEMLEVFDEEYGYCQLSTDIATDEESLVEYILDSFADNKMIYTEGKAIVRIEEENLKYQLFDETLFVDEDSRETAPMFKMIDGKLCYFTYCNRWRRRKEWIEAPFCFCQKLAEDEYDVAYIVQDGDIHTIEGFKVVLCDDGVWKAKYHIEIK